MTPAIYRNIFGMTIFMTVIMMVIMFAGKNVFNLNYFAATQTIDRDIYGESKMIHFTLIWNTFVFCQVFNLICCRDVSNHGMNGFSGLHKNFMTYLIILIIFAVQFLSCFTFLGRIFFEAGRTGGREFLVTIVAAASVLLANCLLKLLPDSLLGKVP
jgi:magnesium-transporting ATPase (P-type)